MKLQIKRCRTCGKLGVGPRANKLWPFEGLLYCAEDYKTVLQWHEQREHVTGGVERMREFDKDVVRALRGKTIKAIPPVRWEGYIRECCEMARWALEAGDRRTFVYYFSRAMYAWDLKEMTR